MNRVRRLRVRARLLAALWGLWAAVLLGIYFRQAWQLLGAGPAAWGTLLRTALLALGPPALLAVVIFGAFSRTKRRPPRWIWLLVVGLLVLATVAALNIRLPAAGEAAVRGARGFAGTAAILLAAQVPGAAILRLLGVAPAPGSEAVLFRTASGLGGLAYITFSLAALGAYTVANLRALVGGLLLAAILLFMRTAPRAPGGPRRDEVQRRRLPGSEDPPQRGALIWKVIVLVALLVALVGALAPEQEYDALWYHLAFPRIWLEHGVLLDQPHEYVALYPMTWELLYGTALAIAGPAAAKLLHFSMLPLLGLLVFRATRRLLPGASPWAAVAFFVTIPTVLWEATTAYVDLAFLLHAGLGGYALVHYGGGRSTRWLLLAGVQFGLALATKHLGFLVLAVGVGGFGLALRRSAAGWRRGVAAVAVLIAVSLAIPSPWYIRSWRATGNPIFPEFYGVFGAPAERWDAATDAALNRFEAHFGRPRTLSNLLILPWDVTVHGARYGGAPGPLFLLLLPLLAVARRSLGLPLLLVTLAYVALWASPLSNFQFRFLLPALLPLAPLAARAAARLAGLLRAAGFRGHRAAAGALAFLLVLNLPPFIPLHEVDRVGWEGWLTHVVRTLPLGVVRGAHSEEQYLARVVPSYRAWQFINTRLPADARILTFGGGDNFYSHRARLWADATAARPAVWGAPAGADREALRALATLRVSHLLLDTRETAGFPPGSAAVLDPAFQERWLTPLYQDDRFMLYRIRWEEVEGAGS